MSRQWRKVYVDIARDVGISAAYILDAILSAKDFQNTEEVVFTSTDSEKIGINRCKFQRIITKLEGAGYISRVPASKPLRLVVHDKSYSSKMSYSEETYSSKSADVSAENELSIAQNEPIYSSKSADTTIKRKQENNRELVESKNINNNQLEEIIVSFFQSRNIGREEAERFIQYNRQHYGDSRLTPDNYEELAKMWIHNMKRKPKKKSASDRPAYKTAGQIAEERGCSVEEVIGSGKIQPIPQKKYDEIPGDILEMFGGGES